MKKNVDKMKAVARMVVEKNLSEAEIDEVIREVARATRASVKTVRRVFDVSMAKGKRTH